jgi:surfeit locus 1 family protein
MTATLHFRTQTIPTLLMVLFTPLFCGLGVWQLDRAEQKRQIAGALELRRKLPVLSIGADLPATEELEFRRLQARGRFLHDRTVLIENRKFQGKNGFHVITPLRLTDSGKLLLINRGWVARPPAGEAPDFPRPEGVLTVRGEARIPQPPALDLKPALEATQGMPHWPFLTLENYAAWSGLETLPFVVLQAPEASGAFARQWPSPPAKTAMHIGYAIQWFAFALIGLLIWLRLSLHKQSAGETS